MPSVPLVSMDRRSLLTSGAALTAASVVPGALGTPARGAVPRLTPSRADRLVDSYGICIHLNFRTSEYRDPLRVADWLQRLGVRHVRNRLTPAPDVLDAFAELASRGIRVQGTCGALGDDQTMDSVLSAVRQRFARPELVFDAFEGINEPNNDGVPWIEETRRRTAELHAARQAQALTAIPIVAPALARVTRGGVEGATTAEQATNLGSLAPWVDRGNMHVYPQGRPPSEDIDEYRGYAEQVVGDQPVLCTEGGYFTAMEFVGTQNPVPLDVAAAYAPQHILEHWNRGTLRFFRYQLLEDPDAGTTDRGGTLGTVRTADGRWEPKPDFFTVRKLLSVFADPVDQTFRRRPLSMALRNVPDDLRSASFVKRDGTHLVAMWLDRYLWHPKERTLLVPDLRTPLASVDVVLDQARDVAVERLTPGTTRVLGAVRSATIGLPAGVTVVKIR